MKGSFKRIFALTRRNAKEIMRDPLSLVLTIGMPLAMEILFYLIFHSLTSQFEMKYFAPGIVVFAQSFLALFVGLLIATDRGTSFLTRLYVSKAKSYEFICAYALAVLPIVAIQSILFFLIGGIFDSSIFCVSMIYSVLLSLITSLFFISAGILFGSLCSSKSIGGICSILIAGQSVLSGMWFPTESLGDGIMTAMKVLPFRNATLLVQNVLNGVGDAVTDFLLPLLIIVAYTLIVFILAIIAFKSKMKEK